MLHSMVIVLLISCEIYSAVDSFIDAIKFEGGRATLKAFVDNLAFYTLEVLPKFTVDNI